MQIFKQPRKKGVSYRIVRRAIRPILAEQPRDIRELVRALEVAGHNPLSWSGLTLEQHIERLKCEIVRKCLRDIEDNLGGKKVRPFQSIKKVEALGVVGPDGKTRNRKRDVWISLEDVLVSGTRFAPDSDEDVRARRDVVDIVTLIRNDRDALRRGIKVKIDGLNYVIREVNQGIVFQQSMFGDDKAGEVT